MATTTKENAAKKAAQVFIAAETGDTTAQNARQTSGNNEEVTPVVVNPAEQVDIDPAEDGTDPAEQVDTDPAEDGTDTQQVDTDPAEDGTDTQQVDTDPSEDGTDTAEQVDTDPSEDGTDTAEQVDTEQTGTDPVEGDTAEEDGTQEDTPQEDTAQAVQPKYQKPKGGLLVLIAACVLAAGMLFSAAILAGGMKNIGGAVADDEDATTTTVTTTVTTVPTQTTVPTETTVPAQTTVPTETTVPAQTTVPTETTVPAETKVDPESIKLDGFEQAVIVLGADYNPKNDITSAAYRAVDKIGEKALKELIAENGKGEVAEALASTLALVPELMGEKYALAKGYTYNPTASQQYWDGYYALKDAYSAKYGKSPDAVLADLQVKYPDIAGNYDKLLAKAKNTLKSAEYTDFEVWYRYKNGDAYDEYLLEEEQTKLIDQYMVEELKALPESEGLTAFVEAFLKAKDEGLQVLDQKWNRTAEYTEFVIANLSLLRTGN